MAVEKYHSVEDMNAAPIRASQGDGFERFLRHCARYRTIFPRVYPRGVVKFSSIEEAQEARERITKENARRLRGRAQG